MTNTNMTNQERAHELLKMAKDVGFSWASVAIRGEREFGVRVAGSAVCRENVWRDAEWILLTADLPGKSGSLQLPLSLFDEMPQRLRELHQQIKVQTEDKEYVCPQTMSGQFKHQLCDAEFIDAYQPEHLYSSLEASLKKVRSSGLRATGYVEAKESTNNIVTSDGAEYLIHDHGMTSGFTVDHPASVGASGSSQESGVKMTRERVTDLITRTVDDARKIADRNIKSEPFAPGDYTVVLHPRAVSDIVRTALMYRMFDRRKIEEGQTYLSKHRNELKFPGGMELSQSPFLEFGDETYQEVAINDRLQVCEPLHLIRDGKIDDLHTSAFWAQKTASKETFESMFTPPIHLHASSSDGFDGGIHETLEDLISNTERGVYVANTWYLRMVSIMEGTITGMTRDGVFAIENGKITKPLNNMRWHENPFRILSAADAVTRQTQLLGLSRWAGSSRGGLGAMPALRVPGFHFSSQTKF